jgi:hypothetical protein
MHNDQHEERDHLLRSLDDLDRELAAGDIDPHDYATLRADYTTRAAAILRTENNTNPGIQSKAATSQTSKATSVGSGSGHLVERDANTGFQIPEPSEDGFSSNDSAVLTGPISTRLRVPPERPFQPASRIGDFTDVEALSLNSARATDLDSSSSISKIPARKENQRNANADIRPKRSPARRIIAMVGVLGIAVGSGVAVARFAGERVGSTGLTGTVRQAASPQQQQAEKFMQIGRDNLGSDPIKSLQAFDAALKIDPNIAEAMAYSGWVLRIASLSAEGKDADDLRAGAIRRINEAIVADPTFPDAYAFKGVIALRDQDDPKTALAAFKKLDGLQTPPFVQQLVGSARKEAEEALATSRTTTAPTTNTGKGVRN